MCILTVDNEDTGQKRKMNTFSWENYNYFCSEQRDQTAERLDNDWLLTKQEKNYCSS